MPRIVGPSDVAEFRSRVCVAATELYAEVGHDGFNMRKLAARLGVSAMTTYRYFKDKNEILAALRAQAFARLADILQTAGDTSGSIEERFSAVGRAYAEFAREHQVYYRLMFDLSQASATISPEFRREEFRAREALTNHVRHLADAGYFEGDSDLLGQVLWSAIHGVVALNLAGKLPDAEFDRVLSETLRLLANARGHIFQFEPIQVEPTDARLASRINGVGTPGYKSSPLLLSPAE